jgi:hypothetical protein
MTPLLKLEFPGHRTKSKIALINAAVRNHFVGVHKEFVLGSLGKYGSKKKVCLKICYIGHHLDFVMRFYLTRLRLIGMFIPGQMSTTRL